MPLENPTRWRVDRRNSDASSMTKIIQFTTMRGRGDFATTKTLKKGLRDILISTSNINLKSLLFSEVKYSYQKRHFTRKPRETFA